MRIIGVMPTVELNSSAVRTKIFFGTSAMGALLDQNRGQARCLTNDKNLGRLGIILALILHAAKKQGRGGASKPRPLARRALAGPFIRATFSGIKVGRLPELGFRRRIPPCFSDLEWMARLVASARL